MRTRVRRPRDRRSRPRRWRTRCELEIVAEGVETDWDVEFLAAAGYDYAQGFRYSPALPAEACEAWIRGFNAPSARHGALASEARLLAAAEPVDARRGHVEHDGAEPGSLEAPFAQARRRHG